MGRGPFGPVMAESTPGRVRSRPFRWSWSFSVGSVSDRVAYEVAEYVMKLWGAFTGLAGGRIASQLSEAVGLETAQLVEELRRTGDEDHWNTRIRPTLPKSDS